MNEYSGYIAVWPDGEHQFIAQAIGFPDLRAEAATESEALDKVKNSLSDFLSKARLVKFALPEENPWLKLFGHSADEPDFDAYLEAIQEYRREVDARAAAEDQ